MKENQKTLLADIEQLFTPLAVLPGTSDPPTDVTTARTIELGHGRIEERVITVSSLLEGYSDWPDLAQVFKLERRVWRGTTEVTTEVRYGVTSLPATVASAARVLAVARAEWQIENGLHYRRDVTLREDASQVRRGAGPHVVAVLNNAVIGLTIGPAISLRSSAASAFGSIVCWHPLLVPRPPDFAQALRGELCIIPRG